MGRAFWIAVILGLLASPFTWAVEVKDVRLWRAPDHTRIVFDLSAPTKYKLFELDNPRRIVIDVEQTSFKADVSDLKIGDTPVKSIRTGVHGKNLRVVLDMSDKVDARSFALAAHNTAYDRLVVDLYDLVSTAKDSVAKPTKPAVEPASPSVKKSATQSAKRDIVIAIDAGHGGEDGGATGPKRVREKDVVLAIARALESRFKKDQGFTTKMIRSGDYYVSLKGRRELARKAQADLFVSIHADAFRRPEPHGASVYALSTSGATSTAARYLAERENEADLVGGVSLSDKDDVLAGVLADLSMTSTLDTSLNLGNRVLRNLDDVVYLHKKRVEQAGFAVLKSPDIPSILVETGFISNPKESQKLATSSYQQQMAAAIHSGIKSWFVDHPPSGTLLAWKQQQGGQQYTIARGDTLSGIAQRFNVSVADLKDNNNLSSSQIRIGQKLQIPTT